MMEVFRSVLVFILAGLCEIGGGFLVWQWLREDKPTWYGVLGAAILVLYGVVATFQPAAFGKVYAAYGGFFIVMSLIWAMRFDHYVPDKYDVIGAVVIMLGVFIIYYAPRPN